MSMIIPRYSNCIADRCHPSGGRRWRRRVADGACSIFSWRHAFIRPSRRARPASGNRNADSHHRRAAQFIAYLQILQATCGIESKLSRQPVYRHREIIFRCRRSLFLSRQVEISRKTLARPPCLGAQHHIGKWAAFALLRPAAASGA